MWLIFCLWNAENHWSADSIYSKCNYHTGIFLLYSIDIDSKKEVQQTQKAFC